jgi:hypothetical protein
LSQIYKAVTSGGLPPSVPTSFNTQSGNAVPAANILLVNAYDTTENNDNGIETKGGVAGGDPPGTGAANELDIYLTNRITGSVTTSNATPTTIATFSLGATPAVFTFDIQIVSFNATDINGDGYFISGSARTDGATATLCGTPDKIINEEVSDTADANMVVSGNSVIIQATGIVGKTHRWKALATYIEVT